MVASGTMAFGTMVFGMGFDSFDAILKGCESKMPYIDVFDVLQCLCSVERVKETKIPTMSL